MKTSDRKYLYILGAMTLLMVVMQYLKPVPVDWSPSFTRYDTVPYGSTLLYRFLPDVFPEERITTVDQSVYQILLRDWGEGTNYLFVNLDFEPDPESVRSLLDFATEGNQVFIAAESFKGALADSLNLSTRRDAYFSVTPTADGPPEATARLELLNPNLEQDTPFVYRQGTVGYYFTSFDTSRTTLLGVGRILDEEPHANFIRTDWGDGALYLSTVPRAFTNYNLVADHNASYVFGALSYLPVQGTLWDEYYKVGRAEARTPLRYILSQEPLRWAYWIAVVGLLLFIGFGVKRRQRIIPVVEPLKNTTLEFTETIGRLYYEQGHHLKVARKRIMYLLDYIRTHLNVQPGIRKPGQPLSTDVIDQVAQRSGVEPDEVRALFQMITDMDRKNTLSQAELLALNDRIETFYATTKR